LSASCFFYYTRRATHASQVYDHHRVLDFKFAGGFGIKFSTTTTTTTTFFLFAFVFFFFFFSKDEFYEKNDEEFLLQ